MLRDINYSFLMFTTVDVKVSIYIHIAHNVATMRHVIKSFTNYKIEIV